MKQYLVCLLLFVALAAPLSAFAKGGGGGANGVGLKVGQVWPAGLIGIGEEGAIGYGAFYEYHASDVFAVFADWTHSNHSNDTLALSSYTAGIKTNLFFIDALVPHAFIGLGIHTADKLVPSSNDR